MRNTFFFLFALALLFPIISSANTYGQPYEEYFVWEEKAGPFTATPHEMMWIQNITASKIGGGVEKLGIIGFYFEIVDENGEKIDQDQVYLHHFAQFSDKYPKNLLCPQNINKDIVSAGGTEYTESRIPYPYAFEYDIGDNIYGNLMVMNKLNVNATFYLSGFYKYVRWVEDVNLPARGVFYTVTSCETGLNDADFDLTKNLGGTNTYQALDFQSTFTGSFLFLVGHLHRKGVDVFMTNTDSGQVLFNSRARYNNLDHPDWITGMDYSNSIVPVRMFDNLRIVAVYENEDMKDVMGVIFGFVHVEEEYTGDVPLYQEIKTYNPYVDPAFVADDDGDNENDNNAANANADSDKEFLYNCIRVLACTNILFIVGFFVLIGILVVQKYRHRWTAPMVLASIPTETVA